MEQREKERDRQWEERDKLWEEKRTDSRRRGGAKIGEEERTFE